MSEPFSGGAIISSRRVRPRASVSIIVLPFCPRSCASYASSAPEIPEYSSRHQLPFASDFGYLTKPMMCDNPESGLYLRRAKEDVAELAEPSELLAGDDSFHASSNPFLS